MAVATEGNFFGGQTTFQEVSSRSSRWAIEDKRIIMESLYFVLIAYVYKSEDDKGSVTDGIKPIEKGE